jgi:hypothetical protein
MIKISELKEGFEMIFESSNDKEIEEIIDDIEAIFTFGIFDSCDWLKDIKEILESKLKK